MSKLKLTEIEYSKIIYIRGEKNFSCIFYFDGSNKMYSGTLKKYELLYGKFNFKRIHASYLVNCEYIKEIDFQASFLRLTTDVVIPIGGDKYRSQ